jgi:hypothetical protein
MSDDVEVVKVGGGDLELTVDELRELKKIAAYSKLGRMAWAFIFSLGGVSFSLLMAYKEFIQK